MEQEKWCKEKYTMACLITLSLTKGHGSKTARNKLCLRKRSSCNTWIFPHLIYIIEFVLCDPEHGTYFSVDFAIASVSIVHYNCKEDSKFCNKVSYIGKVWKTFKGVGVYKILRKVQKKTFHPPHIWRVASQYPSTN